MDPKRSTGSAIAVVAALVVTAVTAGVDTTSSPGQATGTVRGVVTTEVEADPAPLRVTADQQVCGTQLPDESLLVGGNGGVANAVVIVNGTSGGTSGEPVVSNRNCAFVPRVQVGPPHGMVVVRSDDPILHNTHAYDEEEYSLFNLAIPFQHRALRRPLRDPGIVALKCDVHAWMRGFIIVTDELSAVTGEGGAFTLTGVPAGEHELRIWHERLRAAPQAVRVPAGGSVDVRWVLTHPE